MPRVRKKSGDVVVSLSHFAQQQERAEVLRRRPGPRPRRAECLVIGHHWRDDPEHEHGLICVVCQAVRKP